MGIGARGRLVLIFAVVTLVLQRWPDAAHGLQFVRTSYAQGAWWQLLTAQWVHLGLWHAVGNALAFGVLVWVSASWLGWRQQVQALCGGYAGVALVLALDPACSYYAGASGALHGLLAGGTLGIALQPGLRTVRLVCAAVLGGLALKLWWQFHMGSDVLWGGWGFPVYHPAHIAGALGGLVAMLVVSVWSAVLTPTIPDQRCQ